LRILVFNWRDIKHSEAGGAEVNIHEQAKRWVEMGHLVTLFTSRPGGQLSRDTIDGIEVFRAGGRYSVYPTALMVYLLKLRKRAEVVLDIENGIPFFTPLFSRKPRALLVHHLHQDQFLVEMGPLMGRFGRFLEWCVVPILYMNSKWIAVSESTAKQKREALLRGIRLDIETIHCGLDHSTYRPGGTKFDRPTILYLGRVKAYKRLDLLVSMMDRVLENVPDAELLIAGTGDALDDVKAAASMAASTGSIRFLGFVSEQEKVDLLRRSWVMATPSMNEGWGMTVLEANSCGTPAVAFRVPGLNESIKSGESGLLADSDDQFIEHLCGILSDSNLRDALAQGAVAWAAGFDWDTSARLMLAALSATANKT
jgi:glycosyltransferase involved in cell wall biosynthesis